MNEATSTMLSSTPQDPEKAPPSGLSVEAEDLRRRLREVNPGSLADRIGAEYSANGAAEGILRLAWWGAPVILNYPELVARTDAGAELPLPAQALFLYHLNRSDGAHPTGTWVSFGELPDGRVYEKAYQGYSGDQLARTFGSQIERVRQACQKAGGEVVPGVGDAAYRFTALPRIPLLLTYWLGEDEFPSTARVLFDRSAGDQLPVDVCAILGKMLVSRVIKAAQPNP
ncbi:MAG TPA: DUF3786 domain-containing protein [Anaerolineaceae bacterium]